MAFWIKPQPHHRPYDFALTYLSNLTFHHLEVLSYQTELFIVPGKFFTSAHWSPAAQLPSPAGLPDKFSFTLGSNGSFSITLSKHFSHCIPGSTYASVIITWFFFYFFYCLAWSLGKYKDSIHAHAWISIFELANTYEQLRVENSQKKYFYQSDSW